MKTVELGLKFIRPVVRSGHWTYKIRQGVAAGLKRRGGFGFIPRSPSPEEKFLLDLDLKGQTVYDVGGYEGVFTLFFAKAVGPDGRVFTFEPNPANCRKIRENLQLNHLANVQLIQLGLGTGRGKSKLVFWPDEPARGTINTDYQQSLRQKGDTSCIEIEIDSLDHQLASNPRLPPPNFIKIDVEAAELEVLAGMNETLKTHRPRLFIEVHSGVDAKQLARNLIEKGYCLRHVETDAPVRLSDALDDATFHLYGVPA
ncbi:MAG TPA: FkbM family methyltransferase [Verrucomicrobiae bacterium]|nr:FkbM family methyltransferase [Verrucomicrobiae bacterium]